jgi:cyclic pyranopterin monophosphate synthase
MLSGNSPAVTEPIRKAMGKALEIATVGRHSNLDIEHLLMGLLREDDPTLNTVLGHFNLEHDHFRHNVEARLAHYPTAVSPYSNQRVTSFSMGLSPRLSHLLSLADEERKKSGAEQADVLHFLLALTIDGEDPLFQMFRQLGITRAGLQNMLDKHIIEMPAQPKPETAPAASNPESASKSDLNHFNEAGRAKMVDISEKEVSTRKAVARGEVTMQPETLALIREGKSKKGDVLAVAQVAGIMAAKKTPDLIPMCHPLLLSGVDLRFEYDDARHALLIEAEVRISGQTGVEMEALTAISVAALTVYDMVKATDKTMQIGAIRLVHKSGGKSGTFDAS